MTEPGPTDRTTLNAGYFDDIYRAHDDPWAFETSDYEAAKYRTTLAALGERRFGNAFEIGCSIGVLTAQLGGVCDRLLAVDISDAPLARARQRCASLPNVRFERLQVPAEFPDGAFDLVVMSEVGYYWSPPDLAAAIQRIEAALQPGGLWLLVHWTPTVADYPLTGDQVHDAVLARAAASHGTLRHVDGSRHDTYRLDLFQKQV